MDWYVNGGTIVGICIGAQINILFSEPWLLTILLYEGCDFGAYLSYYRS